MYIVSTAKGITGTGSYLSSSNDQIAQNQPGMLVAVKTQECVRILRYMKAQEAFAVGQAASLYLYIDNADVDAVSTTSQKTLTATSDFVANEFNDGTFRSAFVSIDANTGQNQTRAIVSNRGSVSVITCDKIWDTALDVTSDYLTYDMNFVCNANTGDTPIPIPYGIALGTVTANYYAWFQVGGFCPLVRAIGTTDAVVAGSAIVASSTAGVVKGPTAAGMTALEASKTFGVALQGSALADAAGRGVAAIIRCPWAM